MDIPVAKVQWKMLGDVQSQVISERAVIRYWDI